MVEPDPVTVTPRVYGHTISGVKFDKNELDECVDITITTTQADGGAPLADFTKGWKKDGVTKLPKSCSETFAAKTMLAACDISEALPKDGGIDGTLVIHSEHFRFEDVELSDAVMKECIEMGGTWKPLDPKSLAWRKAKLAHSRRGLQKAVDKLNENAP